MKYIAENDMIYDFYLSMQSEPSGTEQSKDFSIKSMFYEFMQHKANEVNSGTIKRMMADWTRFYEPVKDRKCLTPDAIDAQIKRGCEYIGIPVKTMHKIRKTYASILLHNGVNLSIVKDMLGHADESTTLKHYIYNIEDSTETDNKVLNALAPQNYAKSDQSDQNIIPFRKLKRAETIEKSTFSAL